MSRLRITLDSVTKAVGSTELASKFSRFKPGSHASDGARADKRPTSTGKVNTAAVSPPQDPTEDEGGKTTTAEDSSDKQRAPETPFVATKTSTPHAAQEANPSTLSSSSATTKQLFHPAALTANMDETYKSLSHHINSYFGTEDGENRQRHGSDAVPHVTPSRTDHTPVLSPVSDTKGPVSPDPPSPPEKLHPTAVEAEKSVPALVTPPRKGFTQYLSYPRPSVQAFVGSYIAPLVPKFRGESKKTDALSAAAVVEEPAVDKALEKTESEQEKAERAKQLLLSQREKIIARVSLDNRTRALVKGLQRVSDVKLLTTRVEELSFHLLEFPETRAVAIKESLLPCLLRLRQASDLPLKAAVREALAALGYSDPVKGRGIRVLSIDGGGTRGLLALQTLHKLEHLTGKRIHQLFDYICGVSTGAILAFMLGIFQIPLDECEDLYRKLGSDIFKQNVIVGTVKMGWSHAFYDSEMWESILKERLGEVRMIESARDPNSPKVAAVSTIVNRGLPLKAYVFRNYRLMPGVRSHYLGDCKHKLWQAIRASSAAPGYFQEFVLGKDLHQDGGLLINNPTALAIHECKCLWPNTPLQCVVSLGTGRYETLGKNSTTYTSLKTKISHVISSATDTEEVHTMLDALLSPDTYFRFNPYMSEDIPLNESREEKLNFLKSEGERYLQCNEAKLKKAASVLGQEKGAIQRLAEWAKLKSDMYEGISFRSKL
ncbi:calcium-independent phospholipase A2-gamma [Oryzias melastigma]|uniref:Patatin-like phospholipase domain containing 8 n=1 Tax=Oryzias melastigma TaxID=30732 RepID=A0A3B3DGI9_ORYME|nr:calcium-independent phospholipase A2-gamma [Oryzias melastigma]